MMPLYRTKRLATEAVQLTTQLRWNKPEWPGWLQQAWDQGQDVIGTLQVGYALSHPEQLLEERLVIITQDGPVRVSLGDWITRLINEAESVIHRLKNRLPAIYQLELDAQALLREAPHIFGDYEFVPLSEPGSMSPQRPAADYRSVGVDTSIESAGLTKLLAWLDPTKTFPQPTGRPVLDNGFFANVHDVGNGLGIAISTDGVGTKLLIAQEVGRYDTVGIDCIAMNANDVLCVGARPIAFVDYLAVERVNPDMLEALGRGFYEGARQAGVAIGGGEIAQIPAMIQGATKGAGFDLAGTCIGVVALSRVLDGRDITEGDIVIGFRSSGLHSNGFTLVRDALLTKARMELGSAPPELGIPLWEELLRPTLIYTKPVLEALEATSSITGLAHITSDGFLNLLRLRTNCGFQLTDLPEPHSIFRLIQKHGRITGEEMYHVFNMGIGFCAIVRPSGADRVLEAAALHGYVAQPIGTARSSLLGRVELPQLGLVGEGKAFRQM